MRAERVRAQNCAAVGDGLGALGGVEDDLDAAVLEGRPTRCGSLAVASGSRRRRCRSCPAPSSSICSTGRQGLGRQPLPALGVRALAAAGVDFALGTAGRGVRRADGQPQGRAGVGLAGDPRSGIPSARWSWPTRPAASRWATAGTSGRRRSRSTASSAGLDR